MPHAAAAAVVAALLSTALTHTARITGASVVTPLSALLPSPLPLPPRLDGRSAGKQTSTQLPSPVCSQFLNCEGEERRGDASCFKRQSQTTRRLCPRERGDEKKREETMKPEVNCKRCQVWMVAHSVNLQS